MVEILIYSSQRCPYCVRAKNLLNAKGVAFKEIDISTDYSLREEMMQKSAGRRTVPQIFIGDYHVGGCDDLYALDSQGELDVLLKPCAPKL